ncbi:MAG: hypothetical protein RIE86_09145 [Imperialibacter sp.]|uniref:hypothetical protein n=1 Tax=Imperialibacter sp. TaxID=2038411 RepID=UPI0032ED1511
MAKDLDQKWLDRAQVILNKPENKSKKVIYVNRKSGHCAFSKNGALMGAGGDEELLAEVTRTSPEATAGKPGSKETAGKGGKPELTAAELAKKAKGEAGETPASNGETAALNGYPDGEPSVGWKFDQLKAYAAAHDVELEKSDNSKKEVLAKIEAAKAAANKDTSGTLAPAGETPSSNGEAGETPASDDNSTL